MCNLSVAFIYNIEYVIKFFIVILFMCSVNLLNAYCAAGTVKDLFKPRSPESVLISLKETTRENRESVLEVCKKIGLSEKVVSILQPTNSAEINSQNFIVTFESDKTLLLRRCCKFQGRERYESLHHALTLLREQGVRVPELCSSFSNDELAYYELGECDKKVCWVFFKYIGAKSCFSGRREELIDAGEQIGKMHACLKKQFDKKSALHETGIRIESANVPSLTSIELNHYIKVIEQRMERGEGDEYDKIFMENRELIRDAASFVESNFALLQDMEDLQNIHFDLNSSNFLVDKDGRITLMDFDELKLGNVYTDIGFAFHRLVTTCLEQGESKENLSEIIQEFFAAYLKNNHSIKFDVKKLTLSTYNRALRNIKTNLVLKYDQNSSDWLSSIPLNIHRLKQVIFLTYTLKSI